MRYRALAFVVSISVVLVSCSVPRPFPPSPQTPGAELSPVPTEMPGPAGLGPWVNLTHVGDVHSLAVQGGYVWAATDGGVIRWDINSATYEKYTSSDGLHRNAVTGVAMDGDGNIWFGTEDPGESTHLLYGLPAVSKFDGRTWTRYGSLREAVEAEYEAIRGTANENDLWTVDSEGRVWVVFSLGVQAFDGTKWMIYEPPNTLLEQEVTALAADESGRVWVASRFAYGRTGGVSVFDGHDWEQYRTEDGLVSPFVSDIAVDRAGDTWFATDHGLSRFDGERWTSYGTADGLAGEIVHQVVVDPRGQVWIAADGGVSVFAGERWRTLTVVDGLSTELIHAIAFEPNGTAWFGGWGGAIDRFDGDQWASYVIEDDLPSYSVNAITVDAQGRVWLGTSGPNPVVYDGGEWEIRAGGEPLSTGIVYAMASDSVGNIWFHTSQGTGRLSSEDGSWTTYGTVMEAVEENYEAVLGTIGRTRLWAIDDADGVWVGAARFDGQAWFSYQDQEALGQTEVTAVAIDEDGRVWFGTRDAGLVVLDGDSWSHYDQETSSLTDNWIKDILVDSENRVWVATPAGLNVITGQWWQVFASEAGLINDNVLSLALDNEDRVWLGTKGGVSRFDGEGWYNYAILDVEDMAVDNDGNVWIGTLFDGLLIHFSERE